jgi:hypothetical protein
VLSSFDGYASNIGPLRTSTAWVNSMSKPGVLFDLPWSLNLQNNLLKYSYLKNCPKSPRCSW